MTVPSFILSPFTYVFLCVYSWRQYMSVAVFGWTCYWYCQCALGLFNGHGGFEVELLGTLDPPLTAGQPETAAELPGDTPAPAADAQNWCANQHCRCSCICCEGSDKILHLCIYIACLLFFFFFLFASTSLKFTFNVSSFVTIVVFGWSVFQLCVMWGSLERIIDYRRLYKMFSILYCHFNGLNVCLLCQDSDVQLKPVYTLCHRKAQGSYSVSLAPTIGAEWTPYRHSVPARRWKLVETIFKGDLLSHSKESVRFYYYNVLTKAEFIWPKYS